MPIVDHQRTGQITVATAGTAVQGPDVFIPVGIYLRALAGNTGVVYFGNNDNSDVDSSSGFELSPGNILFLSVSNMNDLWFDAASNGDKLCWTKA